MRTRETMPDDWTTAHCTQCRETIHECNCQLCENCDEKILPWMEGTECGRYCSHDCQIDDEDRRHAARLEDSREYEIYGTDYDSWYR
jgi:hypothetical protein